jgi:release factor glutamine methyltransferase
VTAGEAQRTGSRRLSDAGVREAVDNASSLLGFVLGWDRAALLTTPERVLTPGEEERFQALVEERAGRRPLQHILGRQAFWRHEFKVTPDVLIPRPETEILVEAALEHLTGLPSPLVADIGTGSGCVALSLALARPDARVHAVDLSGAALAVAQENARLLGLEGRVAFYEGDLLQPLQGLQSRFDLVASNPPYVGEDEIETLAPEVRVHEPRMALVAPGDRCSVYRRLIPEAARALRSGGHLLLEIGAGMEGEVSSLIAAHDFARIATLPDLQGIPRTIIGRYHPKRRSQ